MSGDPYVYAEAEGILINHFGIRNSNKLQLLESHISRNAIKSMLRTADFPEHPSFIYACDIHRRLFGEIYPFAGQPRTILLWKAEIVLGGRTVEYARPENILTEGEAAIRRFREGDWSRPEKKGLWREFAAASADLWKVHPFREGNTRTLLLFMESFSRSKDFPVDMALISKSPSETRDAFVYASDGNIEPLAAVLIGARRSFRKREHVSLGRLSAEAVEVLGFMEGVPVSKARPGQTVNGSVLCTSHGTVLVRSAREIIGVPLESFAAPPANDRRIAVTVANPVAALGKGERVRLAIGLRKEIAAHPELIAVGEDGSLSFAFASSTKAAASAHPDIVACAAASVLKKVDPARHAGWQASRADGEDRASFKAGAKP